KLFNVDDVIKVGQTVAVIELNGGEAVGVKDVPGKAVKDDEQAAGESVKELEKELEAAKQTAAAGVQNYSEGARFYSPLVKNIAREENIPLSELEKIEGSGKEGRVTKNDIIAYLEKRGAAPAGGVALPAEGTSTKGSTEP